MKKLLAGLLFSLPLLTVQAQERDYALTQIRILTSDSLHGRGYVNQGDVKAARYLQGEFARIGLQPLPELKSYLQSFPNPVNTFPGTLKIFYNDTELQPGVDYLLSPESAGGSGKAKVVQVNWSNLQRIKASKCRDRVLMADPGTTKNKDSLSLFWRTVAPLNREAAVFVSVEHGKLTWSVSSGVAGKVLIELAAAVPLKYGKPRSLAWEVEQKAEPAYRSQNVIGMVKGTIADSFVLVTAHYDHLGRMGAATIFPGANDNASGTALMLDLARSFAAETPKYSMLFVAFAGEEAGLVGSRYFTDHPPVPLKNIKMVYNIDLAGGGDKGVTIVNATEYPAYFAKLEELNTRNGWLAAVKKRGKAANSDHYWFSEKGVPAFFMYAEGGVTAYHDVNDTADKLPMNEYEDLFRLVRAFLGSL
ncbi:MAG: M28 family peptidase [Bacteroidia bacterium]|nr:M28 family peptidase [Bacteroidia bacterium]